MAEYNHHLSRERLDCWTGVSDFSASDLSGEHVECALAPKHHFPNSWHLDVKIAIRRAHLDAPGRRGRWERFAYRDVGGRQYIASPGIFRAIPSNADGIFHASALTGKGITGQREAHSAKPNLARNIWISAAGFQRTQARIGGKFHPVVDEW